MKLKSLLLITLTFFISKASANPAPWVGISLNGIPCNGGAQGFGPFDYTKHSRKDKKLTIVEKAHFTPEIENLIRGKSSGINPEGDIKYTLKAWPNHHRALLSIIRFQLKIKNRLSRFKLKVSPECYLQRAIHFSPKDAVSHSLYGYYLRKLRHFENAVKHYEKAISLAPENAKLAYSFSLLLIDLKRYDDAVKYAKIAYQQGRPPKGLKQKLKKLGVWRK